MRRRRRFRRSLAARPDTQVARSLSGLLYWRGRYVEAAAVARASRIEPGPEAGHAWLRQLLAMTASPPAAPPGQPRPAALAGLELTAVPGGTWTRGVDDGPANEWPLRTVTVAQFEI